MADPLAALVDHLRATGIPAREGLPERFEQGRLPRIDLQRVGPAARLPGVNTLGMDLVDVDVDLYVTPAMYATGEAAALTRRLRGYLARLRSRDGVRCLDVSESQPRPDRNPHTKRVGLTVTVGLPA